MIMNAAPATLETTLQLPGGWRGRILGAGDPAFALLALGEAQASPFQSAEWLRAFLAATGTLTAFRLLEIADNAGSTLLLPVVVAQRFGVRLATKPGGAHASFYVPGGTGDPSQWPAPALLDALKTLARAGGIDALLLADCPLEWQHCANALATLAHRRAPNDGAHLTIDAPGETMLDRLSGKDGRKKLRYKRSKLSGVGDLSAVWVTDSATRQGVLDQFLGWKAAQFLALGIPDPFASAEIRMFLARSCTGEQPAIRLFALHADTRLIAVLGGSGVNRHFSGMFTAYDPDPDVSRFSPGDVLVSDLILALAAEGMTGFDLGVGEARYKNHYCPEELPLVDAALAASVPGTFAVRIWRAARAMKGLIKRNPHLMTLAQKVRRFARR